MLWKDVLMQKKDATGRNDICLSQSKTVRKGERLGFVTCIHVLERYFQISEDACLLSMTEIL